MAFMWVVMWACRGSKGSFRSSRGCMHTVLWVHAYSPVGAGMQVHMCRYAVARLQVLAELSVQMRKQKKTVRLWTADKAMCRLGC